VGLADAPQNLEGSYTYLRVQLQMSQDILMCHLDPRRLCLSNQYLHEVSIVSSVLPHIRVQKKEINIHLYSHNHLMG